MTKNKVVYNTVTKGGGKNFADDGLLGDEGNAAVRMITLGEDVAAELVNIFDEMSFKFEFVAGLELVFAGFLEGSVEFDAKLMIKGVEFEMVWFGGVVGELMKDFELLTVICAFCRHICLL